MKIRYKIGTALLALGLPVYWLLTYCHHKFSRPFTMKKDGKRETYVVCFSCGKEFDFDLETMQIGKRRKP